MWSIAIWIIKNIKTMLNLQTADIVSRINTGSNVQIVDDLDDISSDGVYLIYQNVDLT